MYFFSIFVKNTSMEDKVKKVNTVTETVVDTTTGELIDVSVKTISILTNPAEFSLIYSGFWNILIGSNLSKSDIELAAYLIHNYADNTPFCINAYIKEEVSKNTGKAITTYDRSVAELLKCGLIYKVAHKMYKVNPRYAFKGSSKARHKLVIEMVTTCPTC